MTFDDGRGARSAPIEVPTDAPGASPDVPAERYVERREEPVNVSVAPDRRDLIRWGAVWAGLIVALPTFFLLMLLFTTFGWLTLAQGEPGSTAGWISGLIGLLAFLLGGLVAGATAMWRGTGSGLFHGVMVWALGVVSIIFLTLFGGGALFGSVASVIAQAASLQQANLPDVQIDQAVEQARSAAGWAVLGLALSLVAAAVGGLVGAKMWPRKKDTAPRTVEVR